MSEKDSQAVRGKDGGRETTSIAELFVFLSPAHRSHVDRLTPAEVLSWEQHHLRLLLSASVVPER